MRHLLPGIVIFGSLMFAFFSCSSGSYDIEEVEETDSSHIYSNIPSENNDPIKQEFKNETKQEIKTEIKKSSTRYSIQLGAFEIETNAMSYIIQIKSKLGYDLTYEKVNGLYKIKFGDFGSRSEAMALLGKIQDSGFLDSFITESNK